MNLFQNILPAKLCAPPYEKDFRLTCLRSLYLSDAKTLFPATQSCKFFSPGHISICFFGSSLTFFRYIPLSVALPPSCILSSLFTNHWFQCKSLQLSCNSSLYNVMLLELSQKVCLLESSQWRSSTTFFVHISAPPLTSFTMRNVPLKTEGLSNSTLYCYVYGIVQITAANRLKLFQHYVFIQPLPPVVFAGRGLTCSVFVPRSRASGRMMGQAERLAL